MGRKIFSWILIYENGDSQVVQMRGIDELDFLEGLTQRMEKIISITRIK